MTSHPTRNDALRSLSALGAGVLLAVTPHCGGQSEGTSDDSGESGGSGNNRGGASGSAGVYDGPGMYGGGGYGGVGTAGYGGSVGSGGAVGIGGNGGSPGTGGTCYMATTTACYTPAQLAGCFPADGGVNDGGPGEGGFGGEANDPLPDRAAPNPDAGALPDSGIRPPDPQYICPPSPPVPACIEDPGPVAGFVSPLGWNGVACCYRFDMGCF